ncbi:hypothetical protein [Rhizobium laguerreae]|uniref:hypothetical protein n=1 Tax=Rhizobium laguerreae TaxID=1076926 RepID=UPI001C8FE00C|nr:hypothetical protein [Rhizobium laguerreae]MBY3127374.1 hypothetical protein [Rhizobium laguerreae]MBY3250204.1 hypothetical protein [Rhizobium laguerreae]
MFSKIDKVAASVTVGFILSALSAVASAYSAYQAAEQVRYARQSLLASDINRSFENFYTSWTKLCKAIDLTEKVIFEARAKPNERVLIVTATDFGYTFPPFDYDRYRTGVIDAIREAGDNYEKLSIWLPHEELAAINFDSMLENITIMSRVDASENEAVRYDSIFRQVGYCSFWRPQLTQWFQNRKWHVPPILASQVQLVFQTTTGEGLTEAYIKESRETK